MAARIDAITKQKKEYIESILKNDVVLMQQRGAEGKAVKEGDTKEAQQIRRDIAKREALLTTGALSVLNQQGFLDIEQQLMALAGLTAPSYGGLRKVDAAKQAVTRANG